MKKTISLILAITMLFSAVFCADFSAFSEECQHEYSDTVTPATCVAEGSVVHQCTKCEYSYTEVLPKDENAHKLVNGKCAYCDYVDENYVDTYSDLVVGDKTERQTIYKGEYKLYHITPSEDGCFKFRVYLYKGNTNYTTSDFKLNITCNGKEQSKYYRMNYYYTGLDAGKEYVLRIQNKYEDDCSLQIETVRSAHNYKKSVISSETCVDNGLLKYTCTTCGKTYTEETQATGIHDYCNGICCVCGGIEENYVEEIIQLDEVLEVPFNLKRVGAINHYTFIPSKTALYAIKINCTFLSSDSTDRKFPTVTLADENSQEIELVSSGYSEPYFCAYFNLEQGKNYTITLESNSSMSGAISIGEHVHNMVADSNVPKCDEYVTHITACTGIGCNNRIVVEYEPTEEHEYVETVHAPTCSVFGYTEYACKNCGKGYVCNYVPIDENAHSFANGTCKYCGKLENETVASEIILGQNQQFTVHGENDIAVFTFTPSEDGYYYFKSTGSKYDPYVELYDEDGNYIDSADDTETTLNFALICELTKGVKYYLYFGCYYDDENDTTAQTVSFYSKVHEHSYSKSTIKATCGSKGYTAYSCSCGDYYITDVTPITGSHNFVLEKTFKATCSKTGYKLYECSKCGETKVTETEPATGVHVYENGVCKYCGKTEDVYCHNGVLTQGVPYSFESNDKFAEINLTFIASEDAVYLFETKGESEVSGFAVEEGKEDEEVGDVNDGVAENVRISINAQAGKTYIITIFAEKEDGVKLTAVIKKHIHNSVCMTVPATCGVPGGNIYTCMDCLVSYMEIIEPTGQHNFKNGVCTECGEKETEDAIVELNTETGATVEAGDAKTFSFTPEHSATVTVYSTGQYITGARVYTESEDSLTGQEEIASDYDSSGELMNFSMTFDVEKGKTYYVETIECIGNYEVHLRIDSLNHNYSKKTVEPTCTEDGYSEYTCECGYSYRDVISATGHSPVTDEAVPATCTTDGKTEGSHCSVCGDTIVKQEVVKAPGHTEAIDKAIPATCTTDGKTEGKHCSVCGEIFVAQEDVKATGHKATALKAVEPTFNWAGKTAGKKCSECGKVLVAQKAVPKLGSPKIGKLKRVKNGFKAKWAKVAGVDGYQIQCSTKKNMKKAKKKNIGKNATSKKIKKLDSNKKYYVRIRAYKTVNGKKLYSKWSPKKKVKTK